MAHLQTPLHARVLVFAHTQSHTAHTSTFTHTRTNVSQLSPATRHIIGARAFVATTTAAPNTDRTRAAYTHLHPHAHHPAHSPASYTANQSLFRDLAKARADAAAAAQSTRRAQGQHGALQRERDHHRISHRRVLQANVAMTAELRRVEGRCAALEEELVLCKEKHKAALRGKMLSTIGRDRAITEAQTLRSTLRDNNNPGRGGGDSSSNRGASSNNRTKSAGPRPGQHRGPAAPQQPTKRAPDTPFPPSVAPSADAVRPPPSLKPMTRARADAMAQARSFAVHDKAVSCLAFHPKRRAIATASDDGRYKVLAMPE